MIQNVLREIGGVGLYGAISVCLFFLVFGVALVRACLLKKSFVESMSALPLEDGERTSMKGDSKHE
jgi:fucose 4-O-acetylase-like acetyltransferase